MIEFDKWFKAEMPNSHKKVNKERIETVIYSCAEAAWDYQQAKIDELQARVDEAIKLLSSGKPLELSYNNAMYALMTLRGNKD